MARLMWKIKASLRPQQLITAAQEGDLNAVSSLIDAGVDVNIRGKHGATALYVAAQRGHSAVCSRLLQIQSCRVEDVFGIDGWTVLHAAVEGGNPDAVSAIRRSGVDLDRAFVRSGDTAVHMAIRKGSVVILKEFSNSDLNIRNAAGDAPIHVSIQTRQFDSLHFLLTHNADPNFRDLQGRTPAHLAAEVRMMDAFPFLAAYGADFKAKTWDGQDAYGLVEKLGLCEDFMHTMVRYTSETAAALRHEVRPAMARDCGCDQCVLYLRCNSDSTDTTSLRRRCEHLQRELQDTENHLQKFVDAFQIPEESVEISRFRLGAGAYGEVRRGRWLGQPVAVKMYHEMTMSPFNAVLWKQEMSICCRMHHPNLVSVYGFMTSSESSAGVDPQYIVMELLECSLEELITVASQTGGERYLSVREQLDIACDCASGILYLHQLRPQSYLHGDIRSSNIFITSDMTAKIGDLGASHMPGCCITAGPMSWNYLAPERRMSNEDRRQNERYRAENTIESDVYSLGVMLIELFAGRLVSRDGALPSMVERGIGCLQLEKLCSRMIKERPSDRPPTVVVSRLLRDECRCDGYISCGRRCRVRGKKSGDVIELYN